jgi:hypothetical protein
MNALQKGRKGVVTDRQVKNNLPLATMSHGAYIVSGGKYTQVNSMYLITAREVNSSFVPVNSLPQGKIELAIDQACSY